MIFISVIVPNYNHDRFLKERIEAILNQTYPHFEVWLLDDASTDDSKTILEQYRHHEKVKGIFYRDQNSGGPFYQWYDGIQRARHDWIWIAESDDSSDPHFLEQCVQQIEKNPSASIVMTQSEWVDSDSKKWFQRQTDFEMEGLKKGRQVQEKYLLFENPIKNASALVFNNKLLDPNEERKITGYRWCGDWALWDLLTDKGDLYFINQPLNHFRRHPDAASNEFYYRGYLYKEGLQLSLERQKKLGAGPGLRLTALYRWSHHLLNQYAGNLKSGRFRLYLFSPLYYCALMHLLMPVAALGKLFGKLTGKKGQRPNQ